MPGCPDPDLFILPTSAPSSGNFVPTKINFVDKEYGKPPESAFIGLGWDVDAQTKRKHYRRFFPDELENIRNQFHMVSPF